MAIERTGCKVIWSVGGRTDTNTYERMSAFHVDGALCLRKWDDYGDWEQIFAPGTWLQAFATYGELKK